MLAIIGWFAMFFFLFMISASMLLVMFDNLGTYNIGGVPNSGWTKFFTLVAFAVVIALWVGLFSIAPFEVTMHAK